MSLILDALNKADDERKKNELPSLHSSHDSGEEGNSSKHQQKIVIGLCAAVFLLFLVVIYLLFSKDKSTSPKHATSATKPVHQTTVKAFDAPNTPGQQGSNSNQSQPQQQSAENDDTYQRMKEKLIAAQYQNTETQTKEKTKTPPSSAKVSQIYQQKTQTTAQSKPVETAKPTPSPKPKAVVKTLEDYPTLSFIGELAYSVQKTIPTVMYTEHMYDAQGEIYVVLNNTKRRKGQQVADKLYLEEILEDGIVLKHETQRFKMIALNSWIRI